jgi:hypothetical protein
MATRPIESDEFKAKRSIEELAREQGVKLDRPLTDYIEPDLWESDEEVDRFIEETYAARRQDADLSR